MSVAIVTGADSGYFYLLKGLLESMSAAHQRRPFDVFVLDFGLTAEQRGWVEGWAEAFVVSTEFQLSVVGANVAVSALPYAVRCYLPELAPGYHKYLWIDSDIWIQSSDYFESYIDQAIDGRLVIVDERESAYSFDYNIFRWTFGNIFLAFGLLNTLRMLFGPLVNCGVFALEASSPVWGLWKSRYAEAVLNSGKPVMDQHSLLAVVKLDKAPTVYLGGKANWICSRARPVLDIEKRVYLTPYRRGEVISLLHLAGLSKKRCYSLVTTRGGLVRRRLLYDLRHIDVLD